MSVMFCKLAYHRFGECDRDKDGQLTEAEIEAGHAEMLKKHLD